MFFGDKKVAARLSALEREVKGLREKVATAKPESVTRPAVRVEPIAHKTRAVVSCITDNFIGLGATFLASLMENGKLSADTSIVLLTDPVYAPLSQENRSLLTRICPRLQFLTPDTSFLGDDLTKRWKEGRHVKAATDAELPNKRSVYIKLCTLRLDQFDSILWLDSDMLLVRSVSELFDLPTPLAMVRGGKPHHHFGVTFGQQKMGFNSGMMLIRKPYIGEKSFQASVALLQEKKHTEKQDQSLLNVQWLNEPRMYLPHHYNWKLGLLKTDEDWDHAFDHARVIHFDGPCKWALKDGSRSNKTTTAFHELRERYEIPMIMEP